MSWKGLQKAASRFPHQLFSKKSDGTNDIDFNELEKKFNETLKLAMQLKEEAQGFRDAFSKLANSQADMAEIVSSIFSLDIGAETKEGGVKRRVLHTPAKALQAANDAGAAMIYCRDEMLSELDSLDSFVVRPTLEFEHILTSIPRIIKKRGRKLIDYDRYRIELEKLNKKSERSPNEEKSTFKVQTQFDTALQDYNYLNDMLKSDLEQLFRLQQTLIQTIFERMYFLQNKVYGMIYSRCYDLIAANKQYFYTYEMDIESGYKERLSRFDAQEEIQNMDLFKPGGKIELSAKNALKRTETQESVQNPHQTDQESYQSYHSYQSYQSSQRSQRQPVYKHATGGLVSSTPAPNRTPISQNSTIYAIALYDFDAQTSGDLSFKQGDKIEMINQTAYETDWWTGKLRGVVGVFPGMRSGV